MSTHNIRFCGEENENIKVDNIKTYFQMSALMKFLTSMLSVKGLAV